MAAFAVAQQRLPLQHTSSSACGLCLITLRWWSGAQTSAAHGQLNRSVPLRKTQSLSDAHHFGCSVSRFMQEESDRQFRMVNIVNYKNSLLNVAARDIAC
ncbi:MAG: hypothetical protein HRT77_16615 [Halioglobus sp.]|nr:hypothetical protein [Halioglobus sp.]